MEEILIQSDNQYQKMKSEEVKRNRIIFGVCLVVTFVSSLIFAFTRNQVFAMICSLAFFIGAIALIVVVIQYVLEKYYKN